MTTNTPPTEGAAVTFGEQMKHKAQEVHFQDKAKEFGDAIAEMARTAFRGLADLVEQNRDKIDGALDKAGQKIDEKMDGKHSDKIAKIQVQVDKGIDKLVEQGEKAGPGVPDDKHSAFDDDTIDGPDPTVSPTPPIS